MESSPNQYTVPMSDKSGEVLSRIDHTLEEYDHSRAQEEANLADLQIFVRAGELSPEQADARHLLWLQARATT